MQDSIAATINSVANQPDSAGVSSRIFSAIKSAAARTGVDFSYLLKKASQESGFDPTAKAATSSATGLFQFTSQTWLGMVKNNGAQYGLGNEAAQISTDASGHMSVGDPNARQAILALRNDPTISAEMAGELDKQNAASLQQNVGGKIGGTELYLAHFLGAGGASDFLSAMRGAPNASAARILPQAAAANPSVFYDKAGQPRSLQQIYQHFADKFDGSTAGATQVASAAPARAASTAFTSAIAAPAAAAVSSAPAAMQLASLYSPASPLAPAAAYHSVAGAARIATSGNSTLFAAMMLGQMSGNGVDSGASLSAFNQTEGQKKNALAVLAAVA